MAVLSLLYRLALCVIDRRAWRARVEQHTQIAGAVCAGERASELGPRHRLNPATTSLFSGKRRVNYRFCASQSPIHRRWDA